MLSAAGWSNLDVYEDYSGFSYPKKEVSNDAGKVREILEAALIICQKADMQVLEIDADTLFEPGKSLFTTLFRTVVTE